MAQYTMPLVMHVEEVEQDQWMEKLMTHEEEKEEEEDRWMVLLLTQVDREEEED